MNGSRQGKLCLGAVALLVAVGWSGLAVLALMPVDGPRRLCALLVGGGLLCAATPVWLLIWRQTGTLCRHEEGLARLSRGNLTGAAQLGHHPAADAARLGLRALADSRRLLDDLAAGRPDVRPRAEDYVGDYAALGERLHRLAWANRCRLRQLAEPVEELTAAWARSQIELRALARATAALQADARRLVTLLERPAGEAAARAGEAGRLSAALSLQTVALRRLAETARQQTEQGRRLSARLTALGPPFPAPPPSGTGQIALPGGSTLGYSKAEEPPGD